MEKIVVQKIIVAGDVPRMYFNVVSAINNLELKPMDVNVLSFMAVHGNISDRSLRNEFCKQYKTKVDSINNVVSKLKKMGMIVKEDRTIKLAPYFEFDYKKDLQLQIVLTHER